MTRQQSKPLELLRLRVRAEWLDYNNHMNAGFYAVAYNLAMEKFWHQVALGENQVKSGRKAPFVLECHMTYQNELKIGEPLLITAQLLDVDEKKVHVFLRMLHEEKGFLASTYEQITVCVDLETRRSTLMPEVSLEKLEQLRQAQQDLPRPPETGSSVAMHKRKPN
jgi:acyl-CoA thioester hydrolase